jgi:hypothetical protein
VFYVIRLSTCENSFFLKYDPPKDAKTKRTFHGVSRHFRTFKVPTKADGGNKKLDMDPMDLETRPQVDWLR